jgi:regulatory protein
MKVISDIASVLNKIRKYCAYQERSQQEVRDKLYQYGLHKKDVEESIALLISEGYINEERFAIAYAGGKFRIKHWGRIKIRLALKEKKVSDYCIKKALMMIEEEDYYKTLKHLIRQQSLKVKESNIRKKNYKIAMHLISRGFESEAVWAHLQQEEVF